jgi:DNA polymerase-4
MERAIIHINVTDFAVAVERLADGRLQDRPVIVAPEGAVRATVYDMSEEAYRSGVHKGMPLSRARRLCRDARILPPHPARYEQAMADLLRQALPFSPLIEPGEDDGHLFVDVSGTHRIFGPPVDVAWRMRRQTRKALGLNPIWSLATNKLVAKVASRLVKPLGEYIVAPGDETALLAPLPLWMIPGIEAHDVRRLQEFNLTRVDQVTALDRSHLQAGFGDRADFLIHTLQGIDTTPVQPVGQQPPRVVLDHTFGTDAHVPERVEGTLYALVERAGRHLRRQGRAARRVGILVDYSDGRRCIRQSGIRPPTANDLALFPFARRALYAAWHRRVRIRHLRLVCDRLVYPPAQMPLFEDERRLAARRESIVAVMDRIRDRFGNSFIKLARGSVGPLAR